WLAPHTAASCRLNRNTRVAPTTWWGRQSTDMPFGDGSPIRPTPAWLHLIRLGCAPSPPPGSALCSSPHSRPGSAAPRLLARGAFASLQRVGEASLGGPGPQGLLLIGMRRPAGQG